MINKELDIIYNMDCIEGMKILPDKSIDIISKRINELFKNKKN